MPAPWVGTDSRYTQLFESFVLSWLKISTVDTVRKHLKLSCNAIDGIMIRAVKRGLARIEKPLSARYINIDEITFKKRHRYITVISDRDGRALALTDDISTMGFQRVATVQKRAGAHPGVTRFVHKKFSPFSWSGKSGVSDVASRKRSIQWASQQHSNWRIRIRPSSGKISMSLWSVPYGN